MSGRPPSETSVSYRVGQLSIHGALSIPNGNVASIAVMVSMLHKKPEHAEKKFKVSSKDGNVIVIRVL